MPTESRVAQAVVRSQHVAGAQVSGLRRFATRVQRFRPRAQSHLVNNVGIFEPRQFEKSTTRLARFFGGQLMSRHAHGRYYIRHASRDWAHRVRVESSPADTRKNDPLRRPRRADRRCASIANDRRQRDHGEQRLPANRLEARDFGGRWPKRAARTQDHGSGNSSHRPPFLAPQALCTPQEWHR